MTLNVLEGEVFRRGQRILVAHREDGVIAATACIVIVEIVGQIVGIHRAIGAFQGLSNEVMRRGQIRR